MVGTYGMSSRLGNVAFDAGSDEAYEKCREILARYKTELTAVAEYLLEHETMDGDTFKTYFTQSGESRQ